MSSEGAKLIEDFNPIKPIEVIESVKLIKEAVMESAKRQEYVADCSQPEVWESLGEVWKSL